MPSLLKTALSVAALAGSALAQLQLTSINLPADNSTATAGSNITVEIGMGDYIQSTPNVVLVIGIEQCYDGYCYPASEGLGTILYEGPFNPVKYTYTYYNYYEDFNVTIPADMPTGPATLTVVNFYTVGESNAPSIEYLNANITIV